MEERRRETIFLFDYPAGIAAIAGFRVVGRAGN